MTARAGVRLLALPPSALADRPVATLEDIDRTLEPDAVWVLGPAREPQAFARARSAFDAPAFHPPLETGGTEPSHRRVIVDGDGAELEIAVVQSLRALRSAPEAVSSALGDENDRTALVCDDVTTTVRPTALETRLEGAETLASALPAGTVTTVLTGSEPAAYDELWRLESETGAVRGVDHELRAGVEPLDEDCVAVRVRGAGPVEGYGRSRSIAVLTLTPDGVERVETHDVTDFGLESVSGIGPKTAERLADRGVSTRTELLETPIETLAGLPNVGRDGARTMHEHARVLETGEPRRLTDESLPGANWSTPPLCVDIETDGLSPTIIWQIGVYDPVADTYRAFVERDDPTDPASVLEAFCDWLLGVHPDRALLTWNGWGFDYRHLGAFIAKHVPYYADEWESIPKFDLYLWAVKNDNALLPGRTNKLEAVADALGYDGAATGLDGAATAAAYQRFMRTGAELEWDRHEAYCEDDCRALWRVYERLRDAPTASASSSFAGVSASNSSDASGSASSTASSSTSASGSEATDSGSRGDTRQQSGSSGTDSEQTGLSDF
ncbi:ribonuclease H-like domain-containing protein [Haloterrigena sp. SYSU A558-1]|uniref:Ribonuclease H-like domain-containing protein n=1 Tax=Haloterrigena gelatinilytica TaxID=2741724 RepID=A0ABX2L905_9EURY|nr:ribonuclease H-like domain-containing protein [Haloterrigena gelatinilytica]NUC72221.1 ribonuclease H-like domain-containing protein [Haloterrigena gelatinilytica]